ncbi:hypothetical protein [Litoreibacter ponti]|uniref:hypothetical protein n=1 Tax=Litoreibacter ponti TaxID=1510457 RepID=UPI0011B26A39|nr:hypothetical protein [Litoreibacter ponti]
MLYKLSSGIRVGKQTLRRNFPQKETVALSDVEASLTYQRFGSAGGNPDKREDTHMWEFSLKLPMKNSFFVTRPAKVLSGLVSVTCPTFYCAKCEFEAKHGRDAWGKISIADWNIETKEHFQRFPQHMIVTDVDDRKQSLQWNGFSKRETEKAINALAQLIFISQSSFALHNDARGIAEGGYYADTLRTSLAHPMGTFRRCFLAPKTRDQAPTTHSKGEVLPNYLRREWIAKSRL